MGKRGPAPKPTNLRVLHGERPYRINQREPQPSAAMLELPGWLSDPAREVWERLAPDLERRGLLTAWDVDTFAVLCNAVAHHRQAAKLVARSGVLIKGRKDAVVKSPAMQVIRDTAQTIRAYAQEFGLTPSARSQLIVPEAHRGDEAERLLS
jgi:P27 family predicted phage terminase small subunit